MQENKRIVAGWMDCYSRGDLEGALAHLDDSVVFTLMLQGKTAPLPKTMTKAEYTQMCASMKERVPEGLQLKPSGFVAEGDLVAVEAESYGRTTDGRLYNNLYHFLFKIQDGKIKSVKEYCDFLHAKEALF